MILLSFEQVRRGLDAEFQPLEPMLTGFRILPASISLEEITACEKQLQVIFPLKFKDIISKYDFGNLTIGSIVFSSSGNYLDELLEINMLFKQNINNMEDIKKFILIAISDPYLYFLDLNSSEIFGLDRDLNFDKRFFISSNFESFIQAIGTIILLRDPLESNCELAMQICNEIGSINIGFWKYLAS